VVLKRFALESEGKRRAKANATSILIQIVYVYNERLTISGLIFIVVELDKLRLVSVLVSLV